MQAPAPDPQPVNPSDAVKPPADHAGRTGLQLSTILSGIALVLAIVALVVAFAIPGPTGASGSTPPGVVIASSSDVEGLYNFLSLDSCASWAGANVSITVPAAGTIVVQGEVTMAIFHTAGTIDGGELFVDNSTASYGCSGGAWGTNWFYDANQSNQEFSPTLFVESVFHVTGAGTYIYDVYAYFGGGSSDDFYSTAMIATYSP